ncbi:uncharacterized protein TNCV_591861 [Trichonephila clavipes]|nr:uncharacterized protein TNCV_591861 [Trichonephila clavipes]
MFSKETPYQIHGIVALCLLVTAVADMCSGLMLERLPRHIPRSKVRLSQDSSEDDDIGESFDTSVEKKRIVQDPSTLNSLVKKNCMTPIDIPDIAL